MVYLHTFENVLRFLDAFSVKGQSKMGFAIEGLGFLVFKSATAENIYVFVNQINILKLSITLAIGLSKSNVLSYEICFKFLYFAILNVAFCLTFVNRSIFIMSQLSGRREVGLTCLYLRHS